MTRILNRDNVKAMIIALKKVGLTFDGHIKDAIKTNQKIKGTKDPLWFAIRQSANSDLYIVNHVDDLFVGGR